MRITAACVGNRLFSFIKKKKEKRKEKKRNWRERPEIAVPTERMPESEGSYITITAKSR